MLVLELQGLFQVFYLHYLSPLPWTGETGRRLTFFGNVNRRAKPHGIYDVILAIVG